MRSGNAISPMPHRGPDASQRKSLAIVVKLIARVFSAPAHMHWDQFVCCRALYSTIPAPGWRSPRWHSCWLNCQRPSENIEDKLSGNRLAGYVASFSQSYKRFIQTRSSAGSMITAKLSGASKRSVTAKRPVRNALQPPAFCRNMGT